MEQEFDWVSFDEDEEILWSGAPDRLSMIPAVIIGVPLIPLIIGIIIIAVPYFQIKHTDYVITNKRLYKKRGMLSRNVIKIDIDKIQNLSFKQGIIGNFLGFGNVEISTAGGGGVQMRFRWIEEPREVHDLITKRIETTGEGSCPECGTDIQQDWQACPECGTQIRERCKECNALLQPEWNYCPECTAATA